jgi:hypothetical protein
MTKQSTIVLIMFIAVLISYGLFFLFPIQPVTTKDVYQYIDHDAKVVCYILKNGNGISCLPLSEVNISE